MGTWALAKDILLAVIAFYGAILSTFNWRQAIKRDRRSLVVKLQTTIPYFGAELESPLCEVRVTNTGHRPVTVTTIALALPNGAQIFSIADAHLPWIRNTSLPAALTDGESASIYIAYNAIGEGLMQRGYTDKVQVTAVCEDSTGTVYRGGHWTIDPIEFQRM